MEMVKLKQFIKYIEQSQLSGDQYIENFGTEF